MEVASSKAMGARRVEEFLAWQLAHQFKREVYRLVQESATARSDFRFRDQLRDSAASVGMNIAEGFSRYRPREFARFLDVAIGSLGEARLWLGDGMDRGHFTTAECRKAVELASRCRATTVRLLQSQRGR